MGSLFSLKYKIFAMGYFILAIVFIWQGNKMKDLKAESLKIQYQLDHEHIEKEKLKYQLDQKRKQHKIVLDVQKKNEMIINSRNAELERIKNVPDNDCQLPLFDDYFNRMHENR